MTKPRPHTEVFERCADQLDLAAAFAELYGGGATMLASDCRDKASEARAAARALRETERHG